MVRADIVEAACALLDEEGAAALSMSRIGERLGVTAMALYRHVADRQDLERAIVEHVFADLDLQPDDHDHRRRGGWEIAVEQWMRQVRDHLLQHPWLGSLLGDRHELSPGWLAALDRLAVVLEDAGLARATVAHELVHISRVTVGTVFFEIRAPLPHAPDTFRTAVRSALPSERHARWRELNAALARYDNDDFFDDVVSSTIARLHASRETVV
jgi:AcrR family transcriptional regulator